MLNLSRTLSSKDIVYNTDMENLFNAFSGIESQRLSLGGLTITPSSNGIKFLVEKADGTDVLSVNTSTTTAIMTGTLEVSGFTKLGDNAIKVKKYTGTTGAAEGNITNVAHGLTGAKILGFTCKVEYAANSGTLPGDTSTAEFEYYISHNATNFVLTLAATNSGSILSKNFIITVIYEA